MNKDKLNAQKYPFVLKKTLKFSLLPTLIFPFSIAVSATTLPAGVSLENFGTSTTDCTTSGSPCIYGTYGKLPKGTIPNNEGTLTYDDTNGNIIEFKFVGDKAFIETLTMKDSALSIQEGSSFAGSGIKQGSFKDSILIGKYISTYDSASGAKADTLVKMDFDGGQEKSKTAFKGSILNYNGKTEWTFKNGANFAGGDILAGAVSKVWGNNKITFTDSSVDGNIINKNSTDTTEGINPNSSKRVSQNISFTNNSTKGYALNGSIQNTVGDMVVSFSNAKMIGDVILSEDGGLLPEGTTPKKTISTTLDFKESSLEGNIITSNTGIRKITFSGKSTSGGMGDTSDENFYGMQGSVANNGGTLDISFDNGASWQQGQGDGSPIITNNSGTLTVYIKPSSNMNGDINVSGGDLKMDFDSSYQNGTFNLTDKSGSSTTISAKNRSSLGGFAGNGMLSLSLDGSSVLNTIENSNVSSSITFSNTLTPPPADPSNPSAEIPADDLRIGGIDFSGKLTGEIKGYNVGDINNHNSSTTDLKITSSTVGNISNVNKLLISQSSTGDISNSDTSASLTLSSMSNQSVGNIDFSGTLDGTFDKTVAKNISINAGSATLKLSNASEISSLSLLKGTSANLTLNNSSITQSINSGGTLDATFENQSTLKGKFVVNDGNSRVSFKNGASMQGLLVGVGGNANTSFSSETSSISFASLGDLFSDGGSSVDLSTMDTKEKQALISKLTPNDLASYLNASKISNYGGSIQTHGGTNKVDFQDSLYLGGSIDTDGGTSNVSLNFSEPFITKLKSNELIKTFLYDGSGPEFFVNTSNGVSNIALSGDVKGIAHFNYTGGSTNIVFSDTIKSPTSPATSKDIGDSTDFNDLNSFDILSSDVSKKQVMVNGHTFEDGLLIRLDAAKANSILSSYRDIFASNSATFHIDKITDSTTYSAKISGILVGEVDSLASSGSTSKNYQAILDENAAFVGSLNISDRNISVELSKGAKLILSSDSNIGKLSSNEDNAPDSVDFSNIIGDTLNQRNALIDLATQGIPSSISNVRSSFSTLKIAEIDDLNHTVFRLAYNPNVDASESADKKADHIIISKVSNSGTQALSNYLQVFQNSQDFHIGDLSDKKIIVVSVANDTSTGIPNLKFNDKSDVLQGYDVITTVFQTKQENSSDGDPDPIAPSTPAASTPPSISSSPAATPSAGSSATSTSSPTSPDSATGGSSTPALTSGVIIAADASADTSTSSGTSTDSKPSAMLPWTNYYIKSADVHIKQSNQDMTQAAISTNYDIFLSNINDLNKRLGELRSNPNEQGAWGRIFNGMSKTNRGQEVSTYNTNIQAGYDFSIPHSSARSYFGAALSYGYDVLNGVDFTGKAQSIELGAYYSFVSEEGFYTDTILKYAFIINKLSLPQNQNSDNSFNSSTISLGEEFGYRWNFLLKDSRTSKHSLYLEPQAELIFGYVGNGTLDQVNGSSYLNSSIDSILAFRARVGGVMGYMLKTASNQTDFRLGLSYVGDIAGGGNIALATNFSQSTAEVMSNQMAMLSLGVNSIISEKWRVYADVDTSFLGKYYNQTYLVSIGGRYGFGKKTSAKELAIARQSKENKNNQQSSKETPNTKIPSGYYWVVYALEDTQALSSKEEELIKKYPYRISYEYQNIKDAQGKTKKVLFKYYLLGGFGTKEGALKNQNIANELSRILNKNKDTKALLKQIK